MFTQFERDKSVGLGVMFDDFITAVGIYVYTNEGVRAVTVSDVVMTFNTTPQLVREAVAAHPWLFSHHNDDPSKQAIESDGE